MGFISVISERIFQTQSGRAQLVIIISQSGHYNFSKMEL